MLVSLRFANFKSFRDEQQFSMVSYGRTSDLSTNLMAPPTLGNRKLVRVCAIYGANAAGKSNFVQALRFIKNYVGDARSVGPGDEIPVRQFALDPGEDRNRETAFEIEFIQGGVLYVYQFSVNRQKVLSESLSHYPSGRRNWMFKRWTEGEKSTYRWYESLNGHRELDTISELTRENRLFLQTGAEYNNVQLTRVWSWFSEKLRVLDANRETSEQRRELWARLGKDDDLRRFVEQAVVAADFGVQGLTVSMHEPNRMRFTAEWVNETRHEEGKPIATAAVLRNLLEELIQNLPNDDSALEPQMLENIAAIPSLRLLHVGSPGSPAVPFAPTDESAGTLRTISLATAWYDAHRDGQILVVDELDASLHSGLLRELIDGFQSPKFSASEAQLIFNTHDATILEDRELLRRDQIWFVEKDATGGSSLYRLTDLSPRRPDNIGKRYLEGRYGALPIIGELFPVIPHIAKPKGEECADCV